MLFELWQRTLRNAPNSWALRDLPSNQSWTFAQLDQAASQTRLPPGPVAFPQGLTPDFLFTLLASWKEGRVVCPLERNQSPPPLDTLPPGCVHLKLTSASTGPSRTIAFTADQLVADVEHIVDTMGLRPDWPNLGVISIAHSYGFSNLALPLLLKGIPLVLCPTSLPEVIRQTARTIGPVTVPAVPALWQAWHDAGAITPEFRLGISAGAPLPLPLECAVHQSTGFRIHNFYGASECGGIAYDSAPEPRTDAACVGAPLQGISLCINHSGCLTVRSRAVGETYWPDPDPCLSKGVYQTTDLATLHGNVVFLHGRTSDLINVAGRKINPESIEYVLRTHPTVRQCLVFGVPADNPGRGDVIVALVDCRAATNAAALRAFLLATLPSWQIPRDWRFVTDLNADTRGKLSRAQWRQRYLQSEL
jgi:acyl-CoA synthetase (AMP-forming)/AMP-acid ligase II